MECQVPNEEAHRAKCGCRLEADDNVFDRPLADQLERTIES
jgi:hypothetical protein